MYIYVMPFICKSIIVLSVPSNAIANYGFYVKKKLGDALLGRASSCSLLFEILDSDDTGGGGVLAGIRFVVEHIWGRLKLQPRHPHSSPGSPHHGFSSQAQTPPP